MNFRSSSSSFTLTQVKMSGFQRGMVKSMNASNTIPRLTLCEDIDLTTLSALRDSIKKSQQKSITFMSFFIKSFSLALLDFPLLNSLYDDDKPFEYT